MAVCLFASACSDGGSSPAPVDPTGRGIVSGRILFEGAANAVGRASNGSGETAAATPRRGQDGPPAMASNLTDWQWNLRAIAVPGAWQVTRGSQDTVVAVLDTGIDTDHPEFAGRLVDGFDFVSTLDAAGDGDGPDPDPTDPVTSATGRVSSGTAVTGVIAASDDGQGLGGIDVRCRVMPLRTVGVDGSTARADLWNALVYAGDLDQTDLAAAPWFATAFPNGLAADRPRPSRAAHVVHVTPTLVLDLDADAADVDVFEGLLAALDAAGIVVVAPAGDLGRPLRDAASVVLPSASERVIAVAALRRAVLIAPDASNRGPEIDLAAPAGSRSPGDALEDPWDFPESGGVPTTVQMPRNQGWATGSALAAAHVTGTVALMRSVAPTLTPAESARILRDTALDRGDPEAHGAGLLHAERAVLSAAGLPAPAESLRVHGGAVTFPADRDGAELWIANPGGPLTDLQPYVERIDYEGAAGWIRTVAWVDPGLGSAAPLTVTVDRTNLPDGFHRATVTLRTLLGTTVEIPVRCQQQSAPRARPFSTIRVELRDAVTGDVLQTTAVPQGESAFRFDEVPQGRYTLVAGSDLDGDDAIDDDGEFFGTWRGTQQTGLVEVRQDSRIEGLEVDLLRRARPVR